MADFVTSPDDLVVRLQAALDEKEATAREAAKYSADEWTTASSAVLDLGIPDLDGLIPLPASPIGHHMESNDPRAVLRLCQAHRDDLDAYVAAQARVDRFPDDDRTRFRQAYLMARGYALGLRKSVELLARGYGLEDKP